MCEKHLTAEASASSQSGANTAFLAGVTRRKHCLTFKYCTLRPGCQLKKEKLVHMEDLWKRRQGKEKVDRKKDILLSVS